MGTQISGGKHRGRRLHSISADIRPTSQKLRLAIFSILSFLPDSPRVLDLYAGSGAFGLEALSRGAAHADFVEVNAKLCKIIDMNIKLLGYQDRAKVVKSKVEKSFDTLLTQYEENFGGHDGGYDLVFLDPPYIKNPWEEVLSNPIWDVLMKPSGVLIAEHSTDMILKDNYNKLISRQNRNYGDSSITIFELSAN
jgi:16S rRNA (guanine966-N2)-methyltransferase|tara:strand:+ start:4548 stop:5132 length:585 start_codon:yes stop_codon:yes gene_type:complete